VAANYSRRHIWSVEPVVRVKSPRRFIVWWAWQHGEQRCPACGLMATRAGWWWTRPGAEAGDKICTATKPLDDLELPVTAGTSNDDERGNGLVADEQ
jgi:hypothetical protein